MRDDFTKLVSDAEAAAHDANMVGLDGPGFLRNAANLYGLNGEGENDPYLMTRAEYEYELARREREYWNNRLLVARDVLDYAYAEGPRESAAATEQRKSDAEAAMTAAKTAYQASLGAIESINADMARIKGIAPEKSECRGRRGMGGLAREHRVPVGGADETARGAREGGGGVPEVRPGIDCVGERPGRRLHAAGDREHPVVPGRDGEDPGG